MNGPIPSRRRQHGAVAVLFLLTLTISLGSLLMALDLTRVQLAQARLQNSLDAGVDAVLARFGANDSRPAADWAEAIEPWVLAAYPRSGFGRSELTDPVPDVTLSPTRLVAEVHGSIRLLSAGLLNLASADLTARRVVNFDPSNLDVVIAIDVSTLQAPGAASDPVRQAATQLVQQLLQRGGTRVAVVPFSDTINLGQLDPAGDWLNPSWRNEPWFADVWRGCVTEIGLDAPVPNALITQPGTPGNLAPLVVRTQENIQLTLSEEELGHQFLRLSDTDPGVIQENNSPELLDASFDYTNIYDNSGGTLSLTLIMPPPESCISQNGILPFSQDANVLGNHLAQLQPDPGSSLLPVGLLWSWRVLDTLPNLNNARQRAIVVLGDGINQPAAPGETTTTVIDDLVLAITIPTLWCNNPKRPCGPPPPGQPQSYTLTGTITVTSSSTRQTVSSLNTDGTAVAVGRSQTNTADLNDYTLALCNAINSTQDADAIRLHWLTLGSSPGPLLVDQCVNFMPERHRPFTAAQTATAVSELIGHLENP